MAHYMCFKVDLIIFGKCFSSNIEKFQEKKSFLYIQLDHMATNKHFQVKIKRKWPSKTC